MSSWPVLTPAAAARSVLVPAVHYCLLLSMLALINCSPTAGPGVEELNELITAHVQELVQVHAPEGELAESPLHNHKISRRSTHSAAW